MRERAVVLLAGAITMWASRIRTVGTIFTIETALGIFLAALLATPSPSLAAVVGPIATKATCGPHDRPETGLQGRASMVDRFAPGPSRAFNCNLELEGQVTGDGSSLGFAITDRCAYMTQWNPDKVGPILDNPGVVVIDAMDSKNPKLVKYLQTPAMIHPNESLWVHQGRKLLVAQENKKGYAAITEIYDISDCTHPVLKFGGIIPGVIFHTGDFSKDGLTLYAAAGEDRADTISAVDISDPSHPRLLAQWKDDDPKISRLHHISVSDDGNTAYIGIGRNFPGNKIPGNYQGLGILDVSEVQARKPNPVIKMIGQPLFWPENDNNQFNQPMTIKGRKYVWQNHFRGALFSYHIIPTGRDFTKPIQAATEYKGKPVPPEQACRSGKPAWGYVDIIDVEDPAHPKQVSGLRLEVHDPKNCLAIAYDPSFFYAYSAMRCDVDNHQDAAMIACGFSEGGVRVFDIRDVNHPREIAYYKPPGVGSADRKASMFVISRETGSAPFSWVGNAQKFHSMDAVNYLFFARGGKEIWFQSFDNGFQIVRFSDELMQREKDLFSRDVTCNGKLRGPHGCP